MFYSQSWLIYLCVDDSQMDQKIGEKKKKQKQRKPLLPCKLAGDDTFLCKTGIEQITSNVHQ